MIAGLEEATAGEILIGGEVVNDVPPKDRDIAMVFQNYALYPHMTVFENMSFGLRLRRTPKAEVRARGGASGENPRHHQPPGSATKTVVRRPAAASRHGPCHRA
jgi:ABC-type sugar transport system ATPase subunit